MEKPHPDGRVKTVSTAVGMEVRLSARKAPYREAGGEGHRGCPAVPSRVAMR
jgi:hypothetical protein